MPHDGRFKVVFLGAAGVGKTSIINHNLRSQFDPNTAPTLGIDFQSRAVRVSGHGGGGGEATVARLQLWDTAGDPRFKCLLESYIRDCQAAVIVYDVGDRASFLETAAYACSVRHLQPDAVVALVGNKADQGEGQGHAPLLSGGGGLCASNSRCHVAADGAGTGPRQAGARLAQTAGAGSRAEAGLGAGAGRAREVPRTEGLRMANQLGILFLETSCVSGHNTKELFQIFTEALVFKAGRAHAPTRAVAIDVPAGIAGKTSGIGTDTGVRQPVRGADFAPAEAAGGQDEPEQCCTIS